MNDIMNINKRKIQKTGVSTYIVSLPKSWIVRNDVKPGNMISIYEEDDQTLKLILNEQGEQIKEASINIDEFADGLEVVRKFTAHYLNGISKITINSNKPISSDYMKDVISKVKKVIGFEIVEESDKKIVFQDFFTANYLSIKKAIKREFNLSKLMMQESKNILNKEVKKMDNIEVWEEEVNKLYLLVRRQINFALHNSMVLRQLGITIKECQDYLILIVSIERMGDAFLEIAEKASKVDKVPQGVLTQLNQAYDKMLDAYEMAFNSIFKKDFALSNQSLKKAEEVLKSHLNFSNEKLSEKNKMELYSIFSRLRAKTNLIEEIAEIGLDVC